jgi:hypothetical protein
VRVSSAVERLGYPTVSILCEGFVPQGAATAAGVGMPSLALAAYPGPLGLHSIEQIEKNFEAVLADRIIDGLTKQPKAVKASPEPGLRDVVFQGTFEDVNQYFHDKEWSDGLPIVPPTVEKVEEFLKYTNHSADEVIGVLLPDHREATIWNVAVNGVMAGCRPEYMPVLIAIVEAMVDPKFGQQHLGNTPGTEILITLNGPIIKDLGFNYEQGALRVGFQSNTSIGRFWRLYLRNVAGFLPHKTDKATFGGTWRVVLAENEAAVTRIGWEPLSVDQGFQAGENVVTVSSCTSTDSIFNVGAPTAERILDLLATRVVDINLHLFHLALLGPGLRPQIMLSPCVAEAIAQGGYTKEKLKQYLFEHALFQVKRFEENNHTVDTIEEAVKRGKLPQSYCESMDPDRFVPIAQSPDDFMIIVSGDPGRDNCLICGQNGYIGYPVSKKIDLPANWKAVSGSNK